VRHGFRPQIDHNERTGATSLYAERGRWSQSGTVASHFAAILLAIAVSCSPALGWREGNLTLLPGEVHHIGHGYDLEMRAGQPVTGHQLEAPLAVLTATSSITQTVRINQPLTFRGVTFHLQAYGPAAQISAPENTFTAAFTGSQAQQVTLSEAGLTLRVAHRPEEYTLFVEALTAHGALVGSGSVAHNQEIEIEGIPIAFSLTQFTVWQVSRDPTFGIAVTSAALLLAAIVISLWVPYRRLWFRVDGTGQAWLAGAGHRAGEFDAMAAEIGRACRPQGESDG
jgi:cytochrome c biogenesis protein ResB